MTTSIERLRGVAAAVAITLFTGAAQGEWVAGAHLSFPGIGHLRAAGSGYDYVPENYSVPH